MSQLQRCVAPLLGVALLALTLAACDSAGTNDVTEDPPEVVPPDAFEIEMDLFSDQNPDQPKTGTDSEHAHFTNAAWRVGLVSFVVKASLAVPAAATGAALHADPVVEDGTWIWEATVDTTDQEMTLRLEGMPEGQNVQWSMNVTVPESEHNNMPLDNFELYTAETALDGSQGSWSLFYPVDGERQHVLDADFTVTDSSTKEITLSVPETADEHAGDTVRYAMDGPERAFEWTQVMPEDDKIVLVTWNAETKAGSIVAPDYNDGEKACWDEHLANVACSE